MSKKKTCGECKNYIAEMYHCQKNDVMAESFNTCEDFERKIITNGDRIRQMSNRELAELLDQVNCLYCPYENKENWLCNRPAGKTCLDGIEAWLNAPAESEVKDE